MKQRRAILSLAVLAGLLVLGALFWPYLLAYLFRPLALALWAPFRVLLSIDQRVYWGLLILLGAALGLRLIPGHPAALEDKYRQGKQGKPPADRVAHWRAALRPSAADPDVTDTLRYELSHLAAALDAQNRAPDPSATAGALKLSPRAADFLRDPGLGARASTHPLAALLWRLPPETRRRLDRSYAYTLSTADEILRAMENTLEIPDDHR